MRIRNPKHTHQRQKIKVALDGYLETVAADEFVSFEAIRAHFNKTAEQWPDGRIHQLLIDAGYGDLVEVG